MSPIEVVAMKEPTRKCRLFFKNEQGTGTLETTLEHAAWPNQSQRFFPPKGETAASMFWPVPYWYATECERVCLL